MYVMMFEIQCVKTLISKSNLCKLLGLSTAEDLIAPDKISASTIIQVYNQIGYIYDFSVLYLFKKSVLPAIWNALFTIMLRCFSKPSTVSNNASRLFHTLLYGIYYVEKVYFGAMLWDQFAQSISSKTKDTEISWARFWSIFVRNAMHN